MNTPAGSPDPGRTVVLVDDVRVFRDGRATHTAQTPRQALAVLNRLRGQRIHQLWLDYDLFEETSQPVVDDLLARAAAGTPLQVDEILVHSSRVPEAHTITGHLQAAGYDARRDFSASIWARNPNTLGGRCDPPRAHAHPPP